MARNVPVLIGLGSNLGDRRGHLTAAVAALGARPGIEVQAVSRLWVTEAWGGPPGQKDFLNAAVLVRTRGLGPRDLLETIREIEDRSGRVRTVRNGPRTLDVDILLWADRRITESDLVIPHPGLHERSFVLGPAAEIAPDLVHPSLGETILGLFRRVGRTGVIEVLEEKDWSHAVGHTSR
ncbi:MAG: 2-amino-4-hydroxy-6-hydroxymethyldihydropteridine diphosphokinase [Planctomycetes bacterium]|nr:2-amino-4-hydroxy-6-hydroxymethyldihydropteridine diphosphokinase [Planctomycetota bacterium]